jgi:hypothetical protein
MPNGYNGDDGLPTQARASQSATTRRSGECFDDNEAIIVSKSSVIHRPARDDMTCLLGIESIFLLGQAG